MDKMETTQSEIDAASWAQVFLVLSLQNAVRFWPDMGLLEVCSDLRTLAEDHHRKFGEIDVNESIAETERADALQRLVRVALARVSELCGGEFANKLLAWAATAFPTDRHLVTQPFLWTQILRNAGRRGNDSLVNLNVSPEKKTRMLTVIIDGIVNQRDIHKELKRAEAEPRGYWDAQKFAEYTEGASPFDLVKEAVLRWRFFRVWGRISSVLSQSEVAELLSWAKAEASQMKIPTELLDIPRYARLEPIAGEL